MSGRETDRVLELHGRWRDRDLPAPEAEELRRLLAGGGETADRFAELLVTDSLIEEVLGAGTGPDRIWSAVSSRLREENGSADRMWGRVRGELVLSGRGRRGLRGRGTFLRIGASLALAASLALFAARYLFQRRTAEPVARVASAEGVKMRRGGATYELEAGAELRRGDAVLVAAAGEAAITYADGTAVHLFADTVAVFEAASEAEARQGKDIRLEKGRLSAEVTAQPRGMRMVVTTGQAEVKVVGTRFTLFCDGSHTCLEVEEGEVEITRISDGRSAVVVALSYARTDDPELAARPLAGLDSGIVGHWAFDETEGDIAHDSSGHGNHGRLVGDPLWSVGRIGGALRLDGVDDWVEIGGENRLCDLPLGDFTVTWWQCQEQEPHGWGRAMVAKCQERRPREPLAGGWRIAAGPLHGRSHADVRLEIAFRPGQTGGGVAEYRTEECVVPREEWTHVAVVWRAAEKAAKIWVNGRSAICKATGGEVGPYAGDGGTALLLGASPGESANRFRGMLDDVRIYSRALSTAESETLARAERE